MDTEELSASACCSPKYRDTEGSIIAPSVTSQLYDITRLSCKISMEGQDSALTFPSPAMYASPPICLFNLRLSQNGAVTLYSVNTCDIRPNPPGEENKKKDIHVGLTIEFFSAQPDELIEVMSLEDFDTYFTRLQGFPVADFSLHLYLPEDMDRLCQALKKQSPGVPLVFRDMLVEQIWYDREAAESLTILSEDFARAWVNLSADQLREITLDWIQEFHYTEPLHETPAYHAICALQVVARDMFSKRTKLILRLMGSSLF